MKQESLVYLESLGDRYPALRPLQPEVLLAAEVMVWAHRLQGKVLICGNGGSAADSEHIVGELMKGFVRKRPLPAADVARLRQAGIPEAEAFAACLQQGIPAIALTGHAALSTAVLNDNDPLMAFAQQAYVYGKPGDVLIGLSTSGNSRNVIAAVQVARAFGLTTIGMTGSSAAQLDALCDIIIKVPACETYQVQEYHLPIYHTLCLMVEEEIFGDAVIATSTR